MENVLKICRVVTSACYPYTSGKTSVEGQCSLPIRQRGGDCPSGILYKIEKRYKASPPYRIRPLVSLPSFGSNRILIGNSRKVRPDKTTIQFEGTEYEYLVLT